MTSTEGPEAGEPAKTAVPTTVGELTTITPESRSDNKSTPGTTPLGNEQDNDEDENDNDDAKPEPSIFGPCRLFLVKQPPVIPS